MADNIAITAGAGTTIATDEVQVTGNPAVGHVQYMKLVDGANGGLAPITAGSAGTLAGSLNIVARRDLQVISVAVANTAAAYSSGNSIGGVSTIANAATIAGGSGTIVGANVLASGIVLGAVDIIFTNSAFTTVSGNNTAFSFTPVTEYTKVQGVAQAAGAYALGATAASAGRISQAINIAIPYVCASGSTSLFAYIIGRSGVTFANANILTLNVYVERN